MNNKTLIESALKKIKSLSIDAAEMAVSQSKGFSVNARLGDVETVEHHLDKNFTITVYDKNRTGSASSTDFSEAAVFATIEKALTIAQFASPDLFAGLADANRLAKTIIDCDLHHPWKITPQDAISLAIDCEKKALSYDARIVNSEGVSVSTVNSDVIYANTLGFTGEYHLSDHSIACSLLAQEKKEMQRDDEYTVARNPFDLISPDKIAEKTAQKVISRLGSRRIKTQTCPVIFHSSVAKSLLGAFASAISGGNLYRQSSFLLNAMGKPVFPEFINILQEPHLLSAMGSRPFDQDGVATEKQFYVENGKLIRNILSSYSARKLGLEATGNAGGVFNLQIQTENALSFDELLSQMNTGLLITELMGQGTNITTGDYSRGAAGFWVDNGKIQFPVDGITIAGNLKNMFEHILAVGDDVDVRGSIRSGSVLIRSMTIAGE